MSQLKKKCKVVLLPTNKAEGAIIMRGSKLVYHEQAYLTQEYLERNERTSHHLYILSDDEIKERDYWASYTVSGTIADICKATKLNDEVMYSETTDCNYTLEDKESWKKVIASTNKSLQSSNNESYPNYGQHSEFIYTPSEAFIKEYIESYNKGQQIHEILVEYEEISDNKTNDFGKKQLYYQRPKVRKDNSIIITSVKDSWSREELIKILDDSISEAIVFPEKFVTGIVYDKHKTLQWIKDNL